MSHSPVRPDTDPTATIARPEAGDPRRWRALALLCLIQFMLVLDMTVVNVALPRMQADLGFSSTGLAWVVNAYVLTAGGLLLLGGRLADRYGRRRIFLTGVAIFGLASVACGAAQGPTTMISSRFVQGGGEALAAPAALGLIALLFPSGPERVRALGMWGGVSGLGAVFGSVLSGALVDVSSWRWIFFINVPIALIALLVVPRLVSESRMDRPYGRIDFVGAVGVTASLVTIVYAFLKAAVEPWGSAAVLAPLSVGLFLLAATVLVESRVQAPLIPLRFLADRTRVTANLVGLLASAGFFTYVFVLTLFEQQLLGYSPLESGLSYLPLGAALGVGIAIGSALLPRLGVKAPLTFAFLGVALGLGLSSMIHPAATYVAGILPGMIVLGLFSGITFPAITYAALHKVTTQDSSLAAAIQNTSQQVGGALGLAVLVTLALRHAGERVALGAAPEIAAGEGFTLALRAAATLAVLAAVLTASVFERGVALSANQYADKATEYADKTA